MNGTKIWIDNNKKTNRRNWAKIGWKNDIEPVEQNGETNAFEYELVDTRLVYFIGLIGPISKYRFRIQILTFERRNK